MKRYTPAQDKEVDIDIMDDNQLETWNEAWHEFEELYDLILGGSHDTSILCADTINSKSYNR